MREKSMHYMVLKLPKWNMENHLIHLTFPGQYQEDAGEGRQARAQWRIHGNHQEFLQRPLRRAVQHGHEAA